MRVFVITGAGVSAESGIPTFRGKDGYWRNLDPAQLATPEAFARDPKLVWEWYRERRNRIWNAQPNAAHAAIANLAQHADEFLLVTQNVDDLHARAGLPTEKIVQIHGDIFLTRCSRCDFGFTERKHDHEHPPSPRLRRTSEQEKEEEEEPGAERFGVRGHVRALKAAIPRWRDRTPKCPECDALMRPGVVWFGEQLPWNEVQRVETYLDRGASDVVIVSGTTATFGYIVDWALRASPERFRGELIEVNPEETPLSRFATQLVREPAAVALPRIVDQLISTRDPRL